MLTINSETFWILITVSFFVPSDRFTTENAIIGGAQETPVKKLNGAIFECPSSLIDETQAIGLGIIELVMRSWECLASNLVRSISILICSFEIKKISQCSAATNEGWTASLLNFQRQHVINRLSIPRRCPDQTSKCAVLYILQFFYALTTKKIQTWKFKPDNTQTIEMITGPGNRPK